MHQQSSTPGRIGRDSAAQPMQTQHSGGVKRAVLQPTIRRQVSVRCELPLSSKRTKQNNVSVNAGTLEVQSVSAAKEPQKAAALVRTGSHVADLPLPGGTTGWPLIGETFDWLGSGLEWYTSRRKKYGDVYRTHILFNDTVMVYGEDALREIFALEHKLVESSWPYTVQKLLGRGSLIVQQFNKHTQQRRVFNQGFTREAMQSYVPTVVDVVYEYVDSWVSKGRVAAATEGKDMALDVAGAVLMGWKFERQELKEFRKWYDQFVQGFISLPFNLPWTQFGKGLVARQVLTDKIDSYIGKAMEERSQRGYAAVKGPANTLDMLLTAVDDQGQPLTREEMKDQALTSLFAGHETTATAVAFVILELYRNPQVMAKLRQEHAQLIRRHGSEITPEVLEAMPYTEAVCKEIIRLRPPVPFVWRRTLEDIEVGGKRIPKGWQVMLLIGRTLREVPEWVGTTDEFNPDRWLEGVESAAAGSNSNGTAAATVRKDPKGYMPFGDGPRVCPGMRLAVLELKMLVTALARKASFEMVDKEEKWIPFGGWVNGMEMDFKPVTEEQLLAEY